MASASDMSDLESKMVALRLRGNEEFKRGNWAEAAELFTRGANLRDARNRDGARTAEARALLLNNRAAAHARLERWRASLDDAIASLAIRRDVPKAWARAITALVHLGLRGNLTNYLWEQAQASLSVPQALEVGSLTIGVVDRAPPLTKQNLGPMYLASMQAEGGPWLALRTGGFLLSTAEHGGGEVIERLRSLCFFRLLMGRLVEVESGDVISRCFLTREAVEYVYEQMGRLIECMTAHAVDALLDTYQIVDVWRLSFAREVTDDELRVRVRQMLVVSEYAEVRGRKDARSLFGIGVQKAGRWVDWAWPLRGTMWKGATAMRPCLGVLRLSLLLKPEEFEAVAGASDLVASILEASAHLVRIYHSDSWTEPAIRHAFKLAKLVCRLSKSRLLEAFGGSLAAEAKLWLLADEWKGHWNATVCAEGTRFVDKFFPDLRKEPSEEVRALMSLQFCDGACEPHVQEKVQEEFVLYHRKPMEKRRRFFCSTECFKEHMELVLSARKRHSVASEDWKEGWDHLIKVRSSPENFVEAAYLGVLNCAGSSFADERVEKMRTDYALAMDVIMALPMVPSPDNHAVIAWSKNVFELFRLQDKEQEMRGSGTQWHKQGANVKSVQRLMEGLCKLGGKFTQQSMLAIASPLSRPLRNATSGVSVPESALASNAPEAVRVRLLELQAVVIVQLMWEDPHLYQHVTRVLNEWNAASALWDQPRAWMLRGQLYSLLSLLGESHGCGECVRVGKAGWVKCWRRFEELADSEELGLCDVLRWLAHCDADSPDTLTLLSRADAAERCSIELWGKAVERERQSLNPHLKSLYEQRPAKEETRRDACVAPDHKKCAACGKEKQRGKVKLKICAACQLVAYCSQDCQRNHWKAHKPICREKDEDARKEKEKGPNPAQVTSNSERFNFTSICHHHYMFPH